MLSGELTFAMRERLAGRWPGALQDAKISN
jgi:hypothetical protein